AKKISTLVRKHKAFKHFKTCPYLTWFRYKVLFTCKVNLFRHNCFSKTHVHPLYQTTNETYGSKKPTIHEMPTIFKGRNRKFSEHSLKRGMYRDNGFNTALDKTKVTGPNATAPFQDRTLYHQVYNYLSKQGNKEV
uniref:Piercer of microtubule wall 1 n=1 Tax=Scleropages formosus TaxID=113540 RepID=A0A8C9WKZ3_SCLFO